MKVVELVRPTPALIGLVIFISACYAVAMELGKSIFYGRERYNRAKRMGISTSFTTASLRRSFQTGNKSINLQ